MILEIAVRIGFYKHSKAIITKMICLIISTNADIFSMNFSKVTKVFDDYISNLLR